MDQEEKQQQTTLQSHTGSLKEGITQFLNAKLLGEVA